MELPSYMSIRCNFEGDVLNCSADINLKSIFEIIDSTSLEKFQSYIQKEITEQEYAQIKFVKLIDNKNYWLNIRLDKKDSQLLFVFNETKKDESEQFWGDIIFEYEYYIHKGRSILKSVGSLIENLFYKNRSDISGILKCLCQSFNFKKSLLLFHNGHDHIMYGKDIVLDFEVSEIIPQPENSTFDDKHFDENIVTKFTDILRMKKYKDTYFKTFIKDDCSDDEDQVYILKLLFGQKVIGYLELVPHHCIDLRKTELQLIQSLSSVLAYVINNKCENKEIEDYIKQKMSISLI